VDPPSLPETAENYAFFERPLLNDMQDQNLRLLPFCIYQNHAT